MSLPSRMWQLRFHAMIRSTGSATTRTSNSDTLAASVYAVKMTCWPFPSRCSQGCVTTLSIHTRRAVSVNSRNGSSRGIPVRIRKAVNKNPRRSEPPGVFPVSVAEAPARHSCPADSCRQASVMTLSYVVVVRTGILFRPARFAPGRARWHVCRQAVTHALDLLVTGVACDVAADHFSCSGQLRKLALNLRMRNVERFGNLGVELLAICSKILKYCGIHPAISCGRLNRQPRSVRYAGAGINPNTAHGVVNCGNSPELFGSDNLHSPIVTQTVPLPRCATSRHGKDHLHCKVYRITWRALWQRAVSPGAQPGTDRQNQRIDDVIDRNLVA